MLVANQYQQQEVEALEEEAQLQEEEVQSQEEEAQSQEEEEAQLQEEEQLEDQYVQEVVNHKVWCEMLVAYDVVVKWEEDQKVGVCVVVQQYEEEVGLKEVPVMEVEAVKEEKQDVEVRIVERYSVLPCRLLKVVMPK